MNNLLLKEDKILNNTIGNDLLQTYKHASHHMEEIKTLVDNVNDPCSSKLVFQSLPKHMRRRAMSHQPKRLPKQYQLIHSFQTRKSGKYIRIKPKKTKSKKKSKKFCLRTHIWHARRFRMVEKWGFKIPHSAYGKTYRAGRRACTKSCLIVDVSYYRCVELIGFLEVIREKFKEITNPKTGLGICAKTFISGKREGRVTLFTKGNYPRDVLGDINFFWKPKEKNKDKRRLWIWIHPSNYFEILDQIIKLFDLQPDLNLDFEKNNIFYNNNENVKLIELKNSLNRFRLTGPLSQYILSKSLKSKFSSNNLEQSWFSKVMSNNLNAQINDLQSNFWGNFSRDLIFSNMIISINVDDPRMNVSKQNKSSTENNMNFSNSTLSESFLWNSNIRSELNNKIGNFGNIYNHKPILISNEKSPFDEEFPPVPVILVHNPSSTVYGKVGCTSGWDIILPKCYGMIFWLSLISNGAKAGGLRETLYIMRENWEDIFVPDTPSGRKQNAELSLVLRKRHFDLPPSKRCNYKKISITSPFGAPFKQLLDEWNLPCTKHLYILRDKQLLEQVLRSTGRENFPKLDSECLIQLKVEVRTRGNPGKLAIICIPKTEDLYNLNCNRSAYMEPLKKDNKSERNKNNLQHTKFLKCLKKFKKEQNFVDIKQSKTVDMIKARYNRNCELWLPENPESVRYQCSREVIGYITQSHYSFLSSRVVCIGYVTAQGLKKLFESATDAAKLILLRGTKSKSYCFAKFEVNLNV